MHRITLMVLLLSTMLASAQFGKNCELRQFKGEILPVANLSIGWIISEKRWCVGK